MHKGRGMKREQLTTKGRGSTFHGLKLYRFDMGVAWLAILMCTTGFLNEILGESPKIGGKPSRLRRD